MKNLVSFLFFATCLLQVIAFGRDHAVPQDEVPEDDLMHSLIEDDSSSSTHQTSLPKVTESGEERLTENHAVVSDAGSTGAPRIRVPPNVRRRRRRRRSLIMAEVKTDANCVDLVTKSYGYNKCAKWIKTYTCTSKSMKYYCKRSCGECTANKQTTVKKKAKQRRKPARKQQSRQPGSRNRKQRRKPNKKKANNKLKLLRAGNVVAFKGGKGRKYCADEGNNVKCNRNWIRQWEKMKIVNAGRGKFAIRGGKGNKLCADETNRIKCNRNRIGQWEKFKAQDAGGGNIALRGGKGNKFCADETNRIKCNRNRIGQWEKFKVQNA